MGLRRFLHEIHRRSIWQVLAVYVFGAWIGYEVILALVEGLALPDWLPGLAIVLFVIGLPLVMAIAIVQEGPRTSAPDLHLLDDLELANGEDTWSPPAHEGPARQLHRALTWRTAFFAGVLAFAAWGVVAAAWLAFGGATGVVVPADAAGRFAPTPAATGTLEVHADPGNAAIRAQLITDSGVPGDPEPLETGATELPAGEYVVEFEHEGYNPVMLIAVVPADSTGVVEARLAPSIPGAEGMVLVPAGSGPGGPVDAPFLMDRHEVTNADYLEFVTEGGYQDASYWPGTMVLDGERLSWAEAVDRFTDGTGIRAPRGWSGGIHPEGKGDHPVVGVTWYEAVAYLRWAGKGLPTVAQWRRAAVGGDGRLFPWGDDQSGIEWRANFSLVDTRPVGSFPAGLSPFGVADMAGNVREWLRGEDQDRKPVVGGSWLDPTYMYEQAESFAPGFTNNAIGFRGVRSFRTGAPR